MKNGKPKEKVGNGIFVKPLRDVFGVSEPKRLTNV
jgi:hypothetical protein